MAHDLSLKHWKEPTSSEESGQKSRSLTLLHGFTQSGSSWEPVIECLGDLPDVVTVDTPGHGQSCDIRANLWETADLLAATGRRGVWVGYSMGGRMALHLALTHPEMVTALVLISATAGIEDAEERARRRDSDEVLAQRLEVEGVEQFVTWWLELPLFKTLSHQSSSMSSRLHNTSSGLASSLRMAGTGTQEPLWDRLSSLKMPVLAIAGQLDKPYSAHAQRIAQSTEDGHCLIVSGAGHACHLEKPNEIAQSITAAAIAAWSLE